MSPDTPGADGLAFKVEPRWLALSIGALLFVLTPPAAAQPPALPVLAAVAPAGPIRSFPLPVSALLPDGSGRDYALVWADRARLAATGWPFRILDENGTVEEYIVATERRAGARNAGMVHYPVVYDDGVHIVLRATPDAAEELAMLGFSVRRLFADPMVWPRATSALASIDPSGFVPDPRVGIAMDRISQPALESLLRQLTGVEPAVADDAPYRFLTRHTRSGIPIQKATRFVFQRLQALGFEVRYQPWSRSGYTNLNVIGTRAGGARSNETVLVTAHLDSMPQGERAPGADDNASGTAAVLAAAGVLRSFDFERTLRFVLFTGEEQGLLGSAQTAAEAYAANERIVAVLNLDMLAWDAAGGPIVRLHTRTASRPGHIDDLAIASVFTNVVAAYGLSERLTALVKADGESASDHARFWDKGYPAILAIEDYPGDFTPYYHTTNDTIDHVNLRYFTAFAQAACGTAAHLALPVTQTAIDILEVVNSDWTPGSGIGAGVFCAQLAAGATESGADTHDLPCPDVVPELFPQWLRIHTDPYGVALQTDARPADHDTLFAIELTAVDTTGAGIACSNRLRFDFIAPPASDRIFTLRVHVHGDYTQDGRDFVCVTNLAQVVGSSGFVDLPNLDRVGDGVAYGLCEIAARQLDAGASACTLRIAAADATAIALDTDVQVGAHSIDALEVSATLGPGQTWLGLASYTNHTAPDLDSFDAGWTRVTRTIDRAALPASAQHYFRLRRTWTSPSPQL